MLMLFLLCRGNKVITFSYKTDSEPYTIKGIDYYVDYDIDRQFDFSVMVKVVSDITVVKSSAAILEINSQCKFHQLVTYECSLL